MTSQTLIKVPGANPAMQLRVLQQSWLQRIANNLICYSGLIWILASLNLAVGSIKRSPGVNSQEWILQSGLLGEGTEFQLCPFLAM